MSKFKFDYSEVEKQQFPGYENKDMITEDLMVKLLAKNEGHVFSVKRPNVYIHPY